MNINRHWKGRSIDDFEKLDTIGQGAYGIVYKVQDKLTGETFAMKKVKMEKETEGFPITALREIKLLKQMSHPHIVQLHEIITSAAPSGPGNVYLILEYMQHDLQGVLRSQQTQYTLSQLKCLLKQLLEGVQYMHSHNILHRDLKCANLLMNDEGVLKVGDFGLSRELSSNQKQTYTNRVVTNWYRAPELFLGCNLYGPEVDMWSFGCILGEVLSEAPVFCESTDLGVIERIWELCGTPSNELCNEHRYFSKARSAQERPRTLKEKYSRCPKFDALALDLLDNLLVLDPKKRLTASQTLAHEYFRSEPLPCTSGDLPRLSKELHAAAVRHELPAKRAPQSGEAEPPSKKRPPEEPSN